jgi:hypothetical protein
MYELSPDVVVERKGGKLIIKTPYDSRFVNELKKVSKTRQWSFS